jgi:hypothetical protein
VGAGEVKQPFRVELGVIPQRLCCPVCARPQVIDAMPLDQVPDASAAKCSNVACRRWHYETAILAMTSDLRWYMGRCNSEAAGRRARIIFRLGRRLQELGPS